jgi:BlaI family penicillinase repressor
MQFLWERRRATAREITEHLAKAKPIAHSTVQTLLRQLERKGAVAHAVEERTFVYHPRVTEKAVAGSAISDLISRLFGGSPTGLVAYLVRNEKLLPEEIEEIRRLVNKEAKP